MLFTDVNFLCVAAAVTCDTECRHLIGHNLKSESGIEAVIHYVSRLLLAADFRNPDNGIAAAVLRELNLGEDNPVSVKFNLVDVRSFTA